ncbi:alginate export family protein [Marinagarivorans algicola]|uniref:alginate export family protein n=1 Tax=Marinagarivorans algicola TaxID=1513270 RepID=UPI003736E1CB
MNTFCQLTLSATISCACIMPAFAQQAASITQALQNADIKLSFRMRYEDVTVTNINAQESTADVLSLKTRLSYISQSFNGWGLGVEMDDVTHLTNFQPQGASISDPEGTEVNQYFLSYKAGHTIAKMGRNRILLDNQRFVGGVGFRQNEQTYDSFRIESKDIKNLTVFGAYITSVKRIFGEQDLRGEHDNQSLLLNAQYAFNPTIKLTGYYYDIDNVSVPALSNATLGMRATGQAAAFVYEAELATQSESGNNNNQYSASYLGLSAFYKMKPLTFKLGYESLGTDRNKGRFITPFATLHKFQGWTDVFLGGGTGNVEGGIDDLYFQMGGQAGAINLAVAYHQFNVNDATQTGFDRFGSELGIVMTGKLHNISLSLKYANFSADENATNFKDTSKLWLTAETQF